MSRKKTSTRRGLPKKVHTGKGKRALLTYPKSTKVITSSPFHHLYQHLRLWLQATLGYLLWLGSYENRLAIFLRKHLVTFVGNILFTIFLTLLGINSPATSIPILSIIYQYRTVSTLIIPLLIIYLLRVFSIGNIWKQKVILHKKKLSKPLIAANIISYMGSSLFLLLLFLVLLKPTWCPAIFCSTPQRTFVTHSQDVYDSNLEVYFENLQSAMYAIPIDPGHYTLDRLPESIGVLPANGQKSALRYHLVLGLQSLQQGHFGITVEEVNLIIQRVLPIPQPLNVWNDTSLINYESPNHYITLYSGQDEGAILPTDYLRFKGGFVHLTPREADQIDIHVVSRVEANILFIVQIIYRVDNESQPHMLLLSLPFQVIFTSSSSSHLYRLEDGHFVPNS